MEHLQLSHRDSTAIIAKDDVVHRYLNNHLSKNVTYQKQIYASDVDPDK